MALLRVNSMHADKSGVTNQWFFSRNGDIVFKMLSNLYYFVNLEQILTNVQKCCYLARILVVL